MLNEKEIKNAKINEVKAINKGLITGNDYIVYLQVQSLYKKAFDSYIESLIPINDIVDKKLLESGLDYGKLEEKQKTIYQKVSRLNSDYLFVRNFFYIERLSKEDLDKFIGKNDITYEMINVTKDTFKDIIKVISDKKSDTFKTCYGFSTPDFFFDNDSLVLFLNYGKNTIELRGQEFIDNKIKKEKYLEELIKSIKANFEEKLGCKVEIKYYKGLI